MLENCVFISYLINCRCHCATRLSDWYTADDNIIRSDIGRISDESQLPVKHVWSSKTDTDHQFVKLKLGPLKCTQGIYEYLLCKIFLKDKSFNIYRSL